MKWSADWTDSGQSKTSESIGKLLVNAECCGVDYYLSQIVFWGESGTFVWKTFLMRLLMSGTTRTSLDKHCRTIQIRWSSCQRIFNKNNMKIVTFHKTPSSFPTTSVHQLICSSTNSLNKMLTGNKTENTVKGKEKSNNCKCFQKQNRLFWGKNTDFIGSN